MVKLGDICSITKGKTGIMKAMSGKYPMVGLGEVDKTNIDYQFDAKAVIIPLVSSTGHGSATMKRVKYIEGKFALGTILCAVIPKDDSVVSAKYLQIYLHENRDNVLVPLMKGAANVTLPIKKLYDVEIPLPSIEEQMRIVGLEENVALINNTLSEEITQQKEYLTKLKQSILQDAISGKLTQEWRVNNPNIEPATELLKQIKATKQQQIKEGKLRKEKPLDPIDESTLPFPIPPTWTWCRLGDISTSIVPNRDKPKSFTGCTPWITQANFIESIFKLNYLPNNLGLSNDEIIKYNARVMPKGSVIMSCVGRFDIVAVADEPVVANQQLHCFVPLCEIEPNYIAYSIRLLSNLMSDKAIKTTIKYLNKTKCESILLPLPPKEEQLIIKDLVSKLFQICSSIESYIYDLEQTAQQLTKSILTETFNE